MLHALDRRTRGPAPVDDAVWTHHAVGMSYERIPPIRRGMAEFLLCHGLPQAYADRLSLSLTEVLTNLVKHPREKPRHIDIRLETSPDGVVLDIADDSTPFATFDAKCKRALACLRSAETLAESGYGLGCILSQHSRVFYHAAAPESGSRRNRFVIEDDPERTAAASGGTADAPQARPVIFLIDDDPVALKAQHRMLADMADVVPFSAAAEALALCRQQKPDLVISDLHMPGMNGIGLRQALAALDGGDTVPFIFLSAVAGGETSPYISRIGIDDYLTKPVAPEKLLATVSRIVARRRQVQQAIAGRFHRDLTALLQPALPGHFGAWRIVTLNRMAEAGGGDFTLHHETADGLLAVLADVMGHGAEAKFFAYAYAGYLRSLFRLTAGRAADAGDFLAHLSRAVADDSFLDGTLLTCQSFRLQPDGRVDMAAAGHPAPVLIRRNDCRSLDVAGPLPGMAGKEGYARHDLRLGAGEKLLFATDGFFSAFDPEGYRRAELLAFLETRSAAPAAILAAETWRRFEETSKTHPHPADDATLVIAEFGGLS